MFIKLKNSVGNNLSNQTQDVLKSKNALQRLGFFDPKNDLEPHGFITRELDNGIKAFQKHESLRVDGLIFPKGETEEHINQSLRKNVNNEQQLPALPPPSVEAEQLPPPKVKKKRTIPGTNIPDQGIPEQGFPGLSDS